MKSLEERKADRLARKEANDVKVGADRDDLQAQAEATVAAKDAAAGVKSAPLASKAGKPTAKKVVDPFAKK